MSLLIKGMEMPTYEQGDIVLRVRWDGRVDKDNSGNTVASAIPVLPHGRLIDADALDADLERQDMHTGEWDAVGFSIEEIENAPTIIPAEESRLYATIKCGGAVTCKEYVDTAGKLRWTGTHSGENKVKAEEGET